MTAKMLLREREVLDTLGISRAVLRTWRQQEKFPQPVRLGARMIAWRAQDVQEWVDGRETYVLPATK